MRSDLGPEKTKFGESLKTPSIEGDPVDSFRMQGAMRWCDFAGMFLIVLIPYYAFFIVYKNYDHFNALWNLDQLTEDLLPYYRNFAVLKLIEKELLRLRPEQTSLYILHGYALIHLCAYISMALVVLMSSIFKYRFLIIKPKLKQAQVLSIFALTFFFILIEPLLPFLREGEVFFFKNVYPWKVLFLNLCLLYLVILSTSAWLSLKNQEV